MIECFSWLERTYWQEARLAHYLYTGFEKKTGKKSIFQIFLETMVCIPPRRNLGHPSVSTAEAASFMNLFLCFPSLRWSLHPFYPVALCTSFVSWSMLCAGLFIVISEFGVLGFFFSLISNSLREKDCGIFASLERDTKCLVHTQRLERYCFQFGVGSSAHFICNFEEDTPQVATCAERFCEQADNQGSLGLSP